ncbi:autotransporter family protein [Bartonella sp. CB74]|uniref:autotransporter family protein n=1 Tax=Bartonella sp. CB74 TaxID=3113620 RepID=UPI002F96B19F
MMKVSKNHLYSCVFATAVFSFLSTVDIQARSDSFMSFLCNENKPYYRCNDGKRHTIDNKVYQFVEVFGEESKKNNSLMLLAPIVAEEFGTVIQATHVKIIGGAYGVLAANNGIIEIDRGSIETAKVGVYAEKEGASVILTDTKIKVGYQESIQGTALFSGVDASIKMIGGSVDVRNAAALYVGTGGSAILDGVTIISKNQKVANEEDEVFHAALNINQHGSIHLKNSSVMVTDIRGLWIGLDVNAQSNVGTKENISVSRVYIDDSIVTVTGNQHGIHFDMDKGANDSEQGFVFLKKSIFEAPAATAIYSSKSSGYIAASKGTEISGDLLLMLEKGASVGILADSSVLKGGTRVSDNSIAELYLSGDSKWILTKRKEINWQNSDRATSSVSFVRLSDSAIVFETPTSTKYQTLRIGNGAEEVFSMQGNARLYLNTYTNNDGSFDNQKTDRILIYGDISGKSTVHVQLITEDKGGETGGENVQGISIIQVYGKAKEDSFQLSSAYITLEGFPYQYYLHAYGPSSSRGNASVAQRLIEGEGDFWDYRLESKYIEPTAFFPIAPSLEIAPHSELKVRLVVPQIPTYLLLPNALFHVGLMDISNQNRQLETMRTAASRFLEIDKNPTLFVHGYSANHHYTSNLSALEYGYGGNLDYNAVEVGILLKTIENPYSATSFGVMGSYGKLSLQPQNVEESQKNSLDKWSVIVYGSMQHDAGLYLDGFLSYGLFKGDIFTLVGGKTATLKGNPLSASLSIGKAFMTGYKGFVFDPQIQVIYQHLQFNKACDIGGFDIEMGKPDQWVMRVGGNVTKTFVVSEKDRATSFYGMFHLIHNFEKKQFVHFKDAFQLASFGSSLEAGVGIYSQLSQKITLHSDLVYQHKLTKSGFSGVHFSAGLRYRF